MLTKPIEKSDTLMRKNIVDRFYAKILRREVIKQRHIIAHVRVRVKPTLRVDINSGDSYGNISICPVGDPDMQ